MQFPCRFDSLRMQGSNETLADREPAAAAAAAAAAT